MVDDLHRGHVRSPGLDSGVAGGRSSPNAEDVVLLELLILFEEPEVDGV